MREVQSIELQYSDKSATFTSNFINLSAFEKAEIFLKVVSRAGVGVDRTVAIADIESTPTLMNAEPDTNTYDIDETKYTVEGAYPAAISADNAVARIILLHCGGWVRIEFAIGGTTGTITFTCFILAKD